MLKDAARISDDLAILAANVNKRTVFRSSPFAPLSLAPLPHSLSASDTSHFCSPPSPPSPLLAIPGHLWYPARRTRQLSSPYRSSDFSLRS